jgi:hypothetical protein
VVGLIGVSQIWLGGVTVIITLSLEMNLSGLKL